jgi:hypothetical protein
MRFELYLKKQGIISAEQLVAALETQINTPTPIGQLALEERLLSARDVFEILLAQCDAPELRFGDLAIEMGLMTRDELMRLLMIQADRKRPIAEILVGQGVLSGQQVATAMAAYRRAQLSPRRPTAESNVASAPRYPESGRSTDDPVAAV